jgi:hypothetical protein
MHCTKYKGYPVPLYPAGAFGSLTSGRDRERDGARSPWGLVGLLLRSQ